MIRTTALASVAVLVAVLPGEADAMQAAPLQNGIDAVATADAHAADHVAIMELANVFENAFDEGDLDAHMATWADEMRFESPFGDYDDREGYREWVTGFSQQMQGMGGTRHLITNNVIDVRGDRATQTCYLVIIGQRMNDGAPGLMATVRFEDELVRTDAGWRFAKRVLHLDQDPSSFQQ